MTEGIILSAAVIVIVEVSAAALPDIVTVEGSSVIVEGAKLSLAVIVTVEIAQVPLAAMVTVDAS